MLYISIIGDRIFTTKINNFLSNTVYIVYIVCNYLIENNVLGLWWTSSSTT